MRFTATWLALLVIIYSSAENTSLASDPSYPTVGFDIPAAIACREISTKTAILQKKLVEAEIPLSVRVGYPADQFQSIRVELATFERLPLIRDFMPKETLVAATEGGVAITESKDGRVFYAYAHLQGVQGVVSGGVEGETQGQSLQRTYTLPVPNVVLATSGTLDRGAGIWFKLERTAQHQLEKQHLLYVIFEVDQAWRCDAVKFAAQGTANKGQVCGEKAFHLGLYLDGDEEAKELASNLGLNEKYEHIVEGQRKVHEIEGYFTYPQLGYGSMAERERVKVRSLQKDFDAELSGLRQFKVKEAR